MSETRHGTGADPIMDNEQTWTFVGHWENDRIVVTKVLPGCVQDDREDDGRWEQGLWAAAGSGPTVDLAQRKVIEEYESALRQVDGARYDDPMDALTDVYYGDGDEQGSH
jgi:hypothetical protein